MSQVAPNLIHLFIGIMCLCEAGSEIIKLYFHIRDKKRHADVFICKFWIVTFCFLGLVNLGVR